ncbi:TPA-induced transmembrane protein [Sorex araneus]|uniref:TPA-induced transmembrane protein n=1 Tax=Sorex araneus TaxID=42254 RepID=UPI0024337286|nr:TPA-induced transmembrane protein [Sorex araneus]
MEGSSPPSPQDAVELSVLQGLLPEEPTPRNGDVQVTAPFAEPPRDTQAKKESPWRVCNKRLFGKCKLWMALVSLLVAVIIMTIIYLVIIRETYIDEDEYEIPELSSNKTFWVSLKIPEECASEQELQQLLLERLTDVYSSSPALSRYFTSVQPVEGVRGDNSTVTYHLLFGVPSEDDSFMEYMMSEELVLGVLRQNFHDQNIPGCETLGLDPASLLLYE